MARLIFYVQYLFFVAFIAAFYHWWVVNHPNFFPM